MSDYKIDKDVPLPIVRGPKYGHLIPLARELQIGDSVLLPDTAHMSGFRRICKRIGITTCVRPEGKKAQRVWRTHDRGD